MPFTKWHSSKCLLTGKITTFYAHFNMSNILSIKYNGIHACRQKIFRVLIFVACVICKKYLIHTLCFLLPNTLPTLKNSTNLETQNTILGSRELHNNEGKLREMVSFWETRQMTYWRYS